jgi:hypothetical protein
VVDCSVYLKKLYVHLAAGGKGFDLPARSKAINDTRMCGACGDFIKTCQGLTYAFHKSSKNTIYNKGCCKDCNNLDEKLKALLKNRNRNEKLQEGLEELINEGKLIFREGFSIADVSTAASTPVNYASSLNAVNMYAPRTLPECFTSSHHSNRVKGSTEAILLPTDQEQFAQTFVSQIVNNEDPKRFAVSLHRKSIAKGGYSKSSSPNLSTFLQNSQYIKLFAHGTFNKENVFAGDGQLNLINCFFGEGRAADDSPLDGTEGLGIPGIKRLVILVNTLTNSNKNNTVTIVVADIVEVSQCYMHLIYFLLEFENPDQVFILARSSGNCSVSVKKWIIHMLSMQAIDSSPEGN